MFDPLNEPSQQQQPRFKPPIGIVEVVLIALVLYVAYQVFWKDDARVSRVHAAPEVVALTDR